MSEWIDVLEPLHRAERAVPAGTMLFCQGDKVRFMYIVRAGCVHLVRCGENGSAAVMQRANAPAALAESSIFSATYHCDAVCVTDVVLAQVEVGSLRRALQKEPALLSKLTRHLAREVQRTRARVEVLSRRTVEERLDTWLVLNGGSLPQRGSWRTVAEDIGVSHEAFYRELQRRRLAGPAKQHGAL